MRADDEHDGAAALDYLPSGAGIGPRTSPIDEPAGSSSTLQPNAAACAVKSTRTPPGPATSASMLLNDAAPGRSPAARSPRIHRCRPPRQRMDARGTRQRTARKFEHGLLRLRRLEVLYSATCTSTEPTASASTPEQGGRLPPATQSSGLELGFPTHYSVMPDAAMSDAVMSAAAALPTSVSRTCGLPVGLFPYGEGTLLLPLVQDAEAEPVLAPGGSGLRAEPSEQLRADQAVLMLTHQVLEPLIAIGQLARGLSSGDRFDEFGCIAGPLGGLPGAVQFLEVT